MPRKRGGGNPISLFSFQDVMMSVMGILILVTLLMALQLTGSVAAVSAVAAADLDDVDDPVDIEEKSRLQTQADRLAREIEEVTRKLEKEALLSVDQREVARGLQEVIAEKHRRIRELQQRVRAARQSAESGEEDDKVLDRRLILLRQEANRLRGELADARLNPKLTYIVQRGEGKSPMIVELRGDRIGVGVPQDQGAAAWFRANDQELLIRQFTAWMESRDAESEYFVVILKPSGMEMYGRLLEAIRKAGFDAGTDYVEEKIGVLPE